MVKHDREAMIEEQERALAQYLREMKCLFQEMDQDFSGVITIDEFERFLANERVGNYFDALGIDPRAGRMIFTLLDEDESGALSIGEFLEGCRRLQGTASALDLAVARHQITCFEQHLQQTGPRISQLSRGTSAMRPELAGE